MRYLYLQDINANNRIIEMSDMSAGTVIGTEPGSLLITLWGVCVRYGYWAVSYTHLDVYKRQAKEVGLARNVDKTKMLIQTRRDQVHNNIAVSYTHLDVYKRQE